MINKPLKSMLQYLVQNPAQTLSVSLFLFIVPDEASSSSRSGSTKKAMVRKQKLQEAVGHHKWRINNILDKKYKPRPAHIIVEEALEQVGKMMEYSVISKNCEHFATQLRYGKAVSWQVSGPIFCVAVVKTEEG